MSSTSLWNVSRPWKGCRCSSPFETTKCEGWLLTPSARCTASVLSPFSVLFSQKRLWLPFITASCAGSWNLRAKVEVSKRHGASQRLQRRAGIYSKAISQQFWHHEDSRASNPSRTLLINKNLVQLEGAPQNVPSTAAISYMNVVAGLVFGGFLHGLTVTNLARWLSTDHRVV